MFLIEQGEILPGASASTSLSLGAKGIATMFSLHAVLGVKAQGFMCGGQGFNI